MFLSKLSTKEMSEIITQVASLNNSWFRKEKGFITKSKLCYSCLASGHKSRNCTNTRLCNIDGCTSKLHNRYLHDASLSKMVLAEKLNSEASTRDQRSPENGWYNRDSLRDLKTYPKRNTVKTKYC